MKKYSVFIIAGIGLLAFIVALVITLGPTWGKATAQSTNSTALAYTLAASWQGTNGEVVRSLYLDDTNLYAAAGLEGLVVFDLPSLQVNTNYITNYPFNDIIIRHIQGKRMALAALGAAEGMGGVEIIDLTEFSNITVIKSTVASNQNPGMLLLISNNLYVGDEKSGFQPYVLNLGKNELVAGKPLGFNTNIIIDVTVAGDKAYVAAKELGVFVVDITAHKIVDNLTSSIAMANAVSVSGKKLAVADKMNGIMLYDLANPNHPELIGNYNTPGDAYDVILDGNEIYIADGMNGVEKVKYIPKDKDMFLLERQFNDGSIAYKLFFSKKDGLLYVACGKDGVRVLR